MALATAALKTAITTILQSNIPSAPEGSPEEVAVGIQTAKDNAVAMAGTLANAIEAFVKSGEVEFTSGNVNGTAPSGGGPITAGLATGGKIS